jgi:hypothetical protein
MEFSKIIKKIFISGIVIAFSFYASLLCLLHEYSECDAKCLFVFGSALIAVILILSTFLSINWFTSIFSLVCLITTLFLTFLYKTEIGSGIKFSMVKLLSANFKIEEKQKISLSLLKKKLEKSNIFSVQN